jgi:hypothetical protein
VKTVVAKFAGRVGHTTGSALQAVARDEQAPAPQEQATVSTPVMTTPIATEPSAWPMKP